MGRGTLGVIVAAACCLSLAADAWAQDDSPASAASKKEREANAAVRGSDCGRA
jgi:hypothetical protein